MDGLVRISRDIFDWKFFDNADVLSVFVYLLVSSNADGAIVTTIHDITLATGVSESGVVTAIDRLVATNRVSSYSTTSDGGALLYHNINIIDANAMLYSDDDIKHDVNKKVNQKENPSPKEKVDERKSRAVMGYTHDFEEAFIATGRKGSKKNAYKRWLAMSDADKERAMRHIPFYYKSRERQYLKDFEGYLNGCYYDNPVYDRQGNLLFDPDRVDNNAVAYAPETGFSILWSDVEKCYTFIGYWNGYIPDGYTDDNRPDGATVRLSNARGTAVWSCADKRWDIM